MKLRTEIEPQFEIAEQRYSKILELINQYEDFVDKNGDEDETEYKRVQALVQNIAQKDVSGYNLYETWEAEGPEVLAFHISLPEPQKMENINKPELQEVVRRITKCNYIDESNENPLALEFSYHLGDYYHAFLKINFPKKYKYALFIKQKDESFLSEDEIVGKLL